MRAAGGYERARVKWYDELLLILIFAMTMAVFAILAMGVSQEMVDKYNLPQPKVESRGYTYSGGV